MEDLHFLPEHKLLIYRPTGVLDIAKVAAYVDALAKRPEYDAANRFFDLTRVEKVDLDRTTVGATSRDRGQLGGRQSNWRSSPRTTWRSDWPGCTRRWRRATTTRSGPPATSTTVADG
jgi:hypothetical protein